MDETFQDFCMRQIEAMQEKIAYTPPECIPEIVNALGVITLFERAMKPGKDGDFCRAIIRMGWPTKTKLPGWPSEIEP